MIKRFTPADCDSVNVGDASLSAIGDIQQAKQYAPTITTVLIAATRPKRPDSTRQTSPKTINFLIGYMAYAFRPRVFNKMAVLLGIFLYHNNTTARGLAVLSSIGVTESYRALNEVVKRIASRHETEVERYRNVLNRAIAYDNFNVTDNIRELRAGEEKVMHNITTGLIKECRHIPPTGLLRTWFRPEYRLRMKDVVHPDSYDRQLDVRVSDYSMLSYLLNTRG